ncbi:MAG TPA: hypothetical protein VHE60_05170 [Pyrinomonadaceae bacterium]|nr:hypothetical protein [Pyrinomonadaceae bacterium]
MAKTKASGKKQTKRGRVKVGRLALDKDTIKDLPGKEQRKIRGGQIEAIKKPVPPLAFLISG